MATQYENEEKPVLTIDQYSDIIKKNVLAMCQVKAQCDDVIEKRKELEAKLLNDMDLVLLKEQESKLKEMVEAMRADLELLGFDYLNLLGEKSGSLFSDAWKVAFKKTVEPVIIDQQAVIKYIVDNWLSEECLKPQEIKKKEFNAFATTQPGENQIPWIELKSVAKITITTK